MKKIICLYIALNIIFTGAFAAPYDFEYLASGRHTLVTLLQNLSKTFIAGDHKVEDESVTPSVPDKEKPKNKHISEVAAALAVVDSIISCTYEGEDMKKMTYYVNNGADKKECYFDSGSYSTSGKFAYDQLTRGSLVYINPDKQGVVDQYRVVAVFDKVMNMPIVDVDSSAIFNSSKISFVSSYILDYGYANQSYGIDLTDGNSLSIPSESYMYTIEPERNSVKIHTGSFSDGDVYKAEYHDDLDKTVVYPVVSVLYDDESVFTCSYSTPVYVDGDITQ